MSARSVRRTVRVPHAFVDGESADVTVEVVDTATGGTLPVIVRWPLVTLRYPSVEKLIEDLGAFGFLGGIRDEIRGALQDCAWDLEHGEIT